MYYTPLIILRSLSNRSIRKTAIKKREIVLQGYKEAVVAAETAEEAGYSPRVVSDDGYFELAKPPSVDGINLADAMAATVEQAMELKSEEENNKK